MISIRLTAIVSKKYQDDRYTHTYTHAHTHTQPHTSAQTHTHAHKHTHKLILALVPGIKNTTG